MTQRNSSLIWETKLHVVGGEEEFIIAIVSQWTMATT